MASKKKVMGVAVGSAFVAGMALAPLAGAAGNPFALQSLQGGYMVAADTPAKAPEAKCGGMKTDATKAGEAKCGGMKQGDAHAAPVAAKATEAKCGGMKTEATKAGEAKCGGMKQGDAHATPTAAKVGEAKCGQGKCGAMPKK